MQINFTNKKLEELESYCLSLKNKILEIFFQNKNVIFLLQTKMGSGKTTFIRKLVNVFDSKIKVTSPSFLGMNFYQSKDLEIYHYDLYQVPINLEEFEEILAKETNKFIFFEWAQNFPIDLEEYKQRKNFFVIECL